MFGYHLPKGVPEKEEPPDSPGDATYYFPIDLDDDTGLAGDPVTGVFFPQDYTYPDTVDVILFFHGDKQSWKTIQDYWKLKGNKHGIKLRQAINEAGKPVVLVAPTLGSNPGWSGRMTGDLDKGGADDLLDQVLLNVGGTVPKYFYRKTPELGRLALAAHSGGGETLLQQSQLIQKYRKNIKAVWGFDCTYNWKAIRNLNIGSNAEVWVQWALSRGDVDFHLHYQTGSSKDPTTDTETVAEAVREMAEGRDPLPGKPTVRQKVPNLHVHGTSYGHYPQLNHNFPNRVASDAFLGP